MITLIIAGLIWLVLALTNVIKTDIIMPCWLLSMTIGLVVMLALPEKTVIHTSTYKIERIADSVYVCESSDSYLVQRENYFLITELPKSITTVVRDSVNYVEEIREKSVRPWYSRFAIDIDNEHEFIIHIQKK